jgi:hypothetical protein
MHQLCLKTILILLKLQQPFKIEKNASNYVDGAILTQHGHMLPYHKESFLDMV